MCVRVCVCVRECYRLLQTSCLSMITLLIRGAVVGQLDGGSARVILQFSCPVISSNNHHHFLAVCTITCAIADSSVTSYMLASRVDIHAGLSLTLVPRPDGLLLQRRSEPEGTVVCRCWSDVCLARSEILVNTTFLLHRDCLDIHSVIM
jgi:hypothetical protein